MGRNVTVEVPRSPSPLLKLAEDLYAKHVKDGTASPLDPALIETMQSLRTQAMQEMDIYENLQRRRGVFAESLAIKLGTKSGQSTYQDKNVRFYLASARDLLLGKFRQDHMALGQWGFDVKISEGSQAVKLPTNPEDIIALAKNILKKHDIDKEASPLRFLDMPVLKTLVETVEPIYLELVQLRKDMELHTEARNRALGLLKTQNSKTQGTIFYCLCSFRNVLLGIYRGQERRLGEWGFVVGEARRRKGKEEKEKVST